MAAALLRQPRFVGIMHDETAELHNPPEPHKAKLRAERWLNRSGYKMRVGPEAPLNIEESRCDVVDAPHLLQGNPKLAYLDVINGIVA